MEDRASVSQNERILAAVAHGSVLLGMLSGGQGGLLVALMIWMTQKQKSTYAAYQARQALVYQAAALAVTILLWMGWTALWIAMILLPVIANPRAYDNATPPGVWIGLMLMIVPIGIGTLLVLYGLWGALRCLGGHPFRYALIGRWMGSGWDSR